MSDTPRNEMSFIGYDRTWMIEEILRQERELAAAQRERDTYKAVLDKIAGGEYECGHCGRGHYKPASYIAQEALWGAA